MSLIVREQTPTSVTVELVYEGIIPPASGINMIDLGAISDLTAITVNGWPVPENLLISINPLSKGAKQTPIHGGRFMSLRDASWIQFAHVPGSNHRVSLLLVSNGAVDAFAGGILADPSNLVPIAGGRIMIDFQGSGVDRFPFYPPEPSCRIPVIRSNGVVGIPIATTRNATIFTPFSGVLRWKADYDTTAGFTGQVQFTPAPGSLMPVIADALAPHGDWAGAGVGAIRVCAGERITVGIRNTSAGALPISLDVHIDRE